MKKLKKPAKLNKGDKVALVSLSWGGAGDSDLLWRYKQGKERLEKVFGLEVVEIFGKRNRKTYGLEFGC